MKSLIKKISLGLIFLTPPSFLYAQNPNPTGDCETPASLACIYGLTPGVPGCNLYKASINPTGGWGAIAVVEALDNPDAGSDLNVFSAYFGLPLPSFSRVFAQSARSHSPSPTGCTAFMKTQGTLPSNCNTGSGNPCDEHVADIEWAHAMAPSAQIIMVEAQSDNIWDKMTAVCLAASLVSQAGGGIVSMSWSKPEFPEETGFDSYFQNTPGVIYVGSSGDYSAPANYPSASPYVISAGGTSIKRDSSKNFLQETAWSTNPLIAIGQKNGVSGGPSLYEARPAYQNSVMKMVGNARGTPDISFDADPSTGECVYSTLHTPAGWFRDGGTSLAAPALSGIINAANHRATTTFDELTYIYGNAQKNYHAYWHDILIGNNGYPALAGYDFTTGLGSPLGYQGK